MQTDLELLAKHSLIQTIDSVAVPPRYLTAFQKCNFSIFERDVAICVLKIEVSMRPLFFRFFEYLLAIIHAFWALLSGCRLRNYTVGKFQIGIVTSLKWTRSKITPITYLRRIRCLANPYTSSKIFRMGLKCFLREYSLTRGDICADFTLFYNGNSKNKVNSLSYEKVLRILSCKYQLQDSVNIHFGKPRRKSIDLDRIGRRQIMLRELDARIESRLREIRRSVICGDELTAVLMLGSTSKRKIISKGYGKFSGDVPVIGQRRLIGSTIKVALYSAFFEKFGVSGTAFVEDCPIEIPWRGELLRPKNSDNKFRGTVTLEYAFANSINIPAVRLIEKMGVEYFVLFLRKLGIYQPLPNTPLLALGAIKLTGAELLATLSPILNSGHLSWVAPEGGMLDAMLPVNNGERVISPATVKIMRQFLRATIAMGTGRYLLNSNHLTGGKTGTSEKARDLWFVGTINQDIYGLVWLGYPDGRPIQASDSYGASATRFAVPLWSELLFIDWNECNLL